MRPAAVPPLPVAETMSVIDPNASCTNKLSNHTEGMVGIWKVSSLEIWVFGDNLLL